MAKKVALVVGHKKTSQGAVNKSANVSEFEFNEKLAKAIVALPRTGIDIEIVYRSTYRLLPARINRLKPDLVVSLHCNAFNKKTDGCEVLYYHKSEDGKKAADVFQKNLQKTLGNTDRGIKPKVTEDRGGYLLKYTNATALILEPFFIDNDDEYKNATDKFDALANSILDSTVACIVEDVI